MTFKGLCVALAALCWAVPAGAASLVASYYWQGKVTASGQRFNPDGLTAAHRTLPFGTRLKVCYYQRCTIVTVNDRGPFVPGRDLDLSRGAARAIGLTGVGRVWASTP